MRAVVIDHPGGPEVLQLRDLPAPSLGGGEVRVRVHAAGVNRADLLQRRGAYQAPPGVPADIPGLEFAGEVVEVGVGAGAARAVGDRVFGLVGGGAYAEELVVDARAVSPMPQGMPFVEAAAVPEAFITAYDAMVTLGRLQKGEVVLVPAAASGVGTAAVQIARALGARSIATSRTAAKLERVRALGADDVVVVEAGPFATEVLAKTGGRGVDVVLELVGGAYVAEDIACAAPGARIVVVGLLAGARQELDLGMILRKRLTLVGTVLRSRPLEEKVALHRMLSSALVPLFAAGALRPVVDRVFSLEQAGEAHEYVASNAGFGKVILVTAVSPRPRAGQPST